MHAFTGIHHDLHRECVHRGSSMRLYIQEARTDVMQKEGSHTRVAARGTSRSGDREIAKQTDRQGARA